MIITDTGCNNILVEGNYVGLSVRRVEGRLEAIIGGLTSVRPHRIGVHCSQHGINALFQRRIVLQSVLPEGGSLRRRD